MLRVSRRKVVDLGDLGARTPEERERLAHVLKRSIARTYIDVPVMDETGQRVDWRDGVPSAKST